MNLPSRSRFAWSLLGLAVPAIAAAHPETPASTPAPAEAEVMELPLVGPRIGEQALHLPLQVVNGHVVVRATLYDRYGATDRVSLELNLDNPDTVTMHGDQLGWLKMPKTGGRFRIVFENGAELLLSRSDITPDRDQLRQDRQNAFSTDYAGPLGDHKVKGCIGLGLLRHYQVLLDLAANTLELTPRANGSASPVVSAGGYTGGFDLRDGLITLPLDAPEAPGARLVLGSSRYDTLIRSKRTGGDLASVVLVGQEPLDLAECVAFRPADWGSAGGPEALLLSGVNLLESFRLEIDWAQSQVRLTRTKDAAPVPADRAYFQAELAGTSEALETFLQEHPGARLAAEGARRLLDRRFAERGVSDEKLLRAVRWLLDTTLPERRTEVALTLVDRLLKAGDREAVAMETALLGIAHSRKAINTQDAYRLHRILGEQYLRRQDLHNAWRHFMSASFTPIDAGHSFLVALGLARVYDRQNRPVRAYSRYKAALALAGGGLPDETQAEVDSALARLRAQIPPETLLLLDS